MERWLSIFCAPNLGTRMGFQNVAEATKTPALPFGNAESTQDSLTHKTYLLVETREETTNLPSHPPNRPRLTSSRARSVLSSRTQVYRRTYGLVLDDREQPECSKFRHQPHHTYEPSTMFDGWLCKVPVVRGMRVTNLESGLQPVRSPYLPRREHDR